MIKEQEQQLSEESKSEYEESGSDNKSKYESTNRDEEEKPIYFWPDITLSLELILAASSEVQERRKEFGPFFYEPLPLPDPVYRQFVTTFTDSEDIRYEGE